MRFFFIFVSFFKEETLHLSISVNNRTTMEIKNLDGSPLVFEQDGKLIFEEVEHTYHVMGLGDLTPVSQVIARFFKPFDAVYWSLRKSHGDEQKAAELREHWAAKGAVASQTGTFLHRQIERFLNGDQQPEMICHTSYKGEFVQLKKDIDITKEWNFFRAFDHDTDYHPFRTEWGVFDPVAHMAGTIDLICSCPDGTYEIYDWKRSNKVDPNENTPWSTGLHGLEHLADTSYRHYCLQQNLYRYIVEQYYGLKISRMNLVVLHPDYWKYRIVPIPRMQREVETILRHL